MTAESITSAMTTVTSIVGDAISLISGNAVLMVFLVAGLVPIGFHIFRSAKNSVK